jgi:pimeloyl-ACP methyl ester carboxylesterase
MNFHHVRLGQGKPLVLFHGLGSTWRSWQPILNALAAERTVIALDLPGFGETRPLPGPVSIETLADASTTFLDAHDLRGAGVVGSSMGARLVLELARRGVVGSTVSLDPGGFWRGWEKTYFLTTIGASVRLVRALQPVMPAFSRSAVGRTLLLAQLSAHPSRLPPDLVLTEMRSFATSPSFNELLHNLVSGPEQQGIPSGSGPPITIGWGRKDRVCVPRQAERAVKRFPDAKLHWFEDCGHFPMWDKPGETVELILSSTR